MTALTILGLLLQLVGLTIAVSGVHQMHTTLTSSPLVWRRALKEAASDGWQWVRINVLRRKPPPQVITGSGAIVMTGSGVAAFGRVRPGEPSPTATIDERLERLEGYVKLLDAEIDSRHKAYDERHQRLDNDLRSLRSDTRAEIGELRADQDRMRTALAGSDGRSLRRTFVGLAITALGVGLTLVQPVADLLNG